MYVIGSVQFSVFGFQWEGEPNRRWQWVRSPARLFTCSTLPRSATHLPPPDISGHFRTFSTRNRGCCARKGIAALVEKGDWDGGGMRDRRGTFHAAGGTNSAFFGMSSSFFCTSSAFFCTFSASCFGICVETHMNLTCLPPNRYVVDGRFGASARRPVDVQKRGLTPKAARDEEMEGKRRLLRRGGRAYRASGRGLFCMHWPGRQLCRSAQAERRRNVSKSVQSCPPLNQAGGPRLEARRFPPIEFTLVQMRLPCRPPAC